MSLYAFVHDDITWCMEEKCPMIDCRRNTVNMINKNGLHSYSFFKGTSECPISRSLDECMDGCVHAKECFSKHKDPDEALAKLQAEFCDACVFSSMEED